MANILPDNEIIEFENQQYVNPQVSLDESTAFIDNLRSSQAARNAEIGQETAQLGTYPTPQSNLGGLGGGGSYFEARYSTPQGVTLANNLRAAAQLDALNTALSNQQAMTKQRYANAQRAARRRAAARYSGGGGAATLPTNTGGVVEEDTTSTVVGVVPSVPGGYTVGNIIPDWDNMTSEITGYTYVPYGQDGKVNYVYGKGGTSTDASETSKRITPTNRLGLNNALPSWGRL